MNSENNSVTGNCSPRVRFRPWIGDRYAEGLLGAKILVLGESHYRWKKSGNIDENPSITKRLVEEQLGGTYSKAFWTKIAKAFINKDPSLDDKRVFWHSVAFYNYIQEAVGDRPRVQPSATAWKTGEDAFLEILEDLRPNLVVVLGHRLWGQLPRTGSSEGATIEGSYRPPTLIYKVDDFRITAFGITHPSAGFNGAWWHPHIVRAIELATQ